MTWFKVDDKLHSHPKVIDLSLAALGLWTRAGSWCADHEKAGGRVNKALLKMFGAAPALAKELVNAGLWEANADGWTFHDWHEYQPTPDRLELQRNATKLRVQRFRNGVTPALHPPPRNAVSNAAPDPTRPDPTRSEDADASSGSGSGGVGVGIGIGDESHIRSAAAAGRVWWMEVFSRDDFPHTGKWRTAYEDIASKPLNEKADVARTIARELGKSGSRQKMTPQHVSDYWRSYAEGLPPGGWKKGSDVGQMLGASEIAAAKAEFTTLEQKYRDSQGEAKKAALAAWTEADTKLKEIKKRYA